MQAVQAAQAALEQVDDKVGLDCSGVLVDVHGKVNKEVGVIVGSTGRYLGSLKIYYVLV